MTEDTQKAQLAEALEIANRTIDELARDLTAAREKIKRQRRELRLLSRAHQSMWRGVHWAWTLERRTRSEQAERLLRELVERVTAPPSSISEVNKFTGTRDACVQFLKSIDSPHG